jgi:hypothetical protein
MRMGIGCRRASVPGAYPPYISESLRPSARMSEFTRWLPPLVEPPKSTSRELAATLSEYMMARRSRLSA